MKTVITIPSDAVTHVLTEMAAFKPVVIEVEKTDVYEITGIEFDTEINSLFLINLFFAGVTHGVKSMQNRIDKVIESHHV
jgi:hypothetical protein